MGSVGSSVYSTFQASICSVGTAVTLALAGVYLHQRGFVDGPGKRALALISQQVTFPLFLFTKIIYCNQDWSSDPCPDVTQSLRSVWPLLFWPAFVVATGSLVGFVVGVVTKTPSRHRRAVVAACALGNSTGLPITLLAVVHTNFPATSELGRIDPTLFLSVYLLLYPVLQWGYGGWLLAPAPSLSDQETVVSTRDPSTNDEEDHVPVATLTYKHSSTLGRNVLNNTEIANLYQQHRKGLTSADEGMYVSELNLVQYNQGSTTGSSEGSMSRSTSSYGSCGSPTMGLELLPEGDQEESNRPTGFLGDLTENTESRPLLEQPALDTKASTLSKSNKTTPKNTNYTKHKPTAEEKTFQRELRRLSSKLTVMSGADDDSQAEKESDQHDVWKTLQNVAQRCFQPPVVGALAGLGVALFPTVRGIFVDLHNRSSSAPLQWFFDGLYRTGLSAVPINMMILGCNLSASFQGLFTPASSNKKATAGLMPLRTMLGIAVGKLLVLPFVGISTVVLLKQYVLDIPEGIDAPFFLVLMIVFLCPTANNVMVMVELSGSGNKSGKESIAAVIALQFALAPIILSLTMSVAIGIATDWS